MKFEIPAKNRMESVKVGEKRFRQYIDERVKAINEYVFYLNYGQLPDGKKPPAWDKEFVRNFLLPRERRKLNEATDQLKTRQQTN